MKLTTGSATHIGRVRKVNQDSFLVAMRDDLGGHADLLLVVADGMGGHAGGEVASRLAVAAVRRTLIEWLDTTSGPANAEIWAEGLREAMTAANDDVRRAAQDDPALRGMGTTCVAAAIFGSTLMAANVGDSRLYRQRSGRLTQLTADHSLVQEYVAAGELSAAEAKGSRFRNVVTRGIGIAREVEPDVEAHELQDGDTILLCSDGLTNMLRDGEIADILCDGPDLQRASAHLIDAANDRGGIDNITVVAARYGVFKEVAGRTSFEPDDLDGASEVLGSRSKKKRDTRPASSSLTWFFLLVISLLVYALVFVGQQVYDPMPSWPFVKPKPAKGQPAGSPAVLSLGNLTYGEPDELTSKPLRPGPLVVSPDGEVHAVTASGKALQLDPTGAMKTDLLVPADSLKPAPAPWCVDREGYLYCISTGEAGIIRYASTGKRVAGIASGKLKAATSVGVDGSGNIYVINLGKLMRIPAIQPPAPRGP